MACEHDENADIGNEKARLPNLTAKPARRIAGTPIALEVDASETHEQLKLDTLGEALGLVHVRTGKLLPSLAVYLGEKCRCIAYLGENGGSRSYTMFLGDQMLLKTAKTLDEKKSGVKGGFGAAERGVADQQYDAKRMMHINPQRVFMSKEAYQATKVHAKAVAVIVHEIGHLLHEANDTKKYWALKMEKNVEGAANDRPPVKLAVQVSQYATKSKLEYVAEVFTGLVFGRHYAPEVIAQYADYGGTPML